MVTRITLLALGSLLAWLLYSKGQEVGWMGGVLWGLAGIGIGVVAISATSVITASKMKKKEEKTAVSLAFLAASAGLLVIGAARMIKW